MNGVQTELKCKPNVKRCKRFVFVGHSPLLHHNTLKTKAITLFQADHILTRFVFPPLPQSAPQQAVSSTVYNQPEPSQPTVRTTDRSGFRQPTLQPAMFPPQQPHPAAGQHGVSRQPGMTSQPRANGLQPVTPETGFAGENYPYANGQQSFDSFGFDPEEEDDREQLREDPYAEYLDFPEEYRMRDQAQQAEMVYC